MTCDKEKSTTAYAQESEREREEPASADVMHVVRCEIILRVRTRNGSIEFS